MDAFNSGVGTYPPFALQKAHHSNVIPKHSSKKTSTHSTKSTNRKTHSVSASAKKPVIKTTRHTTHTAKNHTRATVRQGRSSRLVRNEVQMETVWTEQCSRARKGHKKHCVKVKTTRPLTTAAHKKVLRAKTAAISTLMNQIGKPYHWGGSSPRTGFDCSGLVYYAYKDLVKFHIPRTANEMYHLRDAAPVERGELQSGDLVFFRTEGRGSADHVGVYIGGGKFIQSPRSGQDIQITSLSEDYWQRHYVGARRVMTPKTLR